MFGYDVTKASTLYDFEFVATRADGSEHVIRPYEDLGFFTVGFKRKFLVSYYGSAARDFAQGRIEGDTPAAFQARLTELNRHIAAVLAQRGHPVQSIRIDLIRLNPDQTPAHRRTIIQTQIAPTNAS
jgi:hypothetical protein